MQIPDSAAKAFDPKRVWKDMMHLKSFKKLCLFGRISQTNTNTNVIILTLLNCGFLIQNIIDQLKHDIFSGLHNPDRQYALQNHLICYCKDCICWSKPITIRPLRQCAWLRLQTEITGEQLVTWPWSERYIHRSRSQSNESIDLVNTDSFIKDWSHGPTLSGCKYDESVSHEPWPMAWLWITWYATTQFVWTIRLTSYGILTYANQSPRITPVSNIVRMLLIWFSMKLL